jgi:glycosyltransferase involved in cell wall biosynthesis
LQVSVIVRTKNEENSIGNCLDSLTKQSYKDFEVLLIDAESSDHTLDIVAKYPFARVIVEKGKHSFGHASNIGVSEANGDVLAFLSADCIADEKWLENLVARFTALKGAKESIGGVTGTTVPCGKNWFSRYFLTAKLPINNDKQYFNTANSLIGKKLVVEAGFIDEETWARAEDKALGFRVSENGYYFVQEPSAIAYHKIPESVRAFLKRCFLDSRGSLLMSLTKKLPYRYGLYSLGETFIFFLAVILLLVFPSISLLLTILVLGTAYGYMRMRSIKAVPLFLAIESLYILALTSGRISGAINFIGSRRKK